MKNLIILITLLFSVSAMAQQPKYLEGAMITVTLKNGKTYTYPSREMAVVKRSQMKQPIAIEILKAVKERRVVPNKKTRVYIIGGTGNTGRLETGTNGTRYKTRIKRGGSLGVGIQQKINDGDYNIGVQVQNNGTTSLTIGKDF